MSNEIQKTLTAAILKLLRPLVRLLLRNGMSYGDFADLSRWVFMDVAEKEFTLPERKQSVSRISVITGLTRKEVSRLQKIETPDDSAIAQQYNRAARVIAGWLRDSRFHTSKGTPAELSFDSGVDSFTALAKEHSGDIPPRAILDELLRVGTVEQNEDGNIRLLMEAFVPRTGEKDKLHILGTDVHLLLSTIDHNLRLGDSDPRYQRKVAYDNLPEEALPRFREMSAKKAQALLVELDRHLSAQDRDLNPKVKGSGRKQAGIGIYYFEQDMAADD
ncbi:hypothetical protein DJ031_16160 [bacterium endosymbiont of Escarpia laminata]|nr:MAG: hypothetical protein DJ031_16160 [bacterium endosymbiont of Escarpia laminata]